MGANTHNDTFEEYLNILNGCINRNIPLIKALRLEVDDVRQDLSLRLYRAIGRFDDERGPKLPSFLYHELQHEILDMRRRHKPLGLVGVPTDERVDVVYLDQQQEDGTFFELPVGGDFGSCELAEAISALPSKEREVVRRKMVGEPIRKTADKALLAQAQYTISIYFRERNRKYA